jgi:prefoldin subunit 5
MQASKEALTNKLTAIAKQTEDLKKILADLQKSLLAAEKESAAVESNLRFLKKKGVIASMENYDQAKKRLKFIKIQVDDMSSKQKVFTKAVTQLEKEAQKITAELARIQQTASAKVVNLKEKRDVRSR